MLFKLHLTGFKTIRLAESKVGRVSTDLSYVHNIKKKNGYDSVQYCCTLNSK